MYAMYAMYARRISERKSWVRLAANVIGILKRLYSFCTDIYEKVKNNPMPTELFDLTEENELQSPLLDEPVKVFFPAHQRATEPIIVGNPAPPKMTAIPRATLEVLINKATQYNAIVAERDQLAELVRRCMYMLRDMTGSPEDLQKVTEYVLFKIKNGGLTVGSVMQDYLPFSGITPPTDSFGKMVKGIANTKAWEGFEHQDYLQVCEDNQIPIGDLLPTIVNLIGQMEASKTNK